MKILETRRFNFVNAESNDILKVIWADNSNKIIFKGAFKITEKQKNRR